MLKLYPLTSSLGSREVIQLTTSLAARPSSLPGNEITETRKGMMKGAPFRVSVISFPGGEEGLAARLANNRI